MIYKKYMTKLMKAKDGEDLIILWSATHYDGMMSGFGKYKENPCWICATTNPDWSPRYFKIYLITDEEFAYEENRQKIFAETLGMHTYYEYINGIRYRKKNNKQIKHNQKIISDCYKKMGLTKISKEGRKAIAWFSI